MTVGEIRSAAARLAGVAVRTPLVPFPRVSPELLIKPESLQPTGAFKLRGAYAAISALSPAQRQRGVVAHSSGNHAQAVAYAAAALGAPAVVVVPENAPEVKIAATRAWGAEIVVCAPGLQARIAATDRIVAERGLTQIPPFEDRGVIAGQGTVGLEIAEDCPAPAAVVVPVGGGGLISGVAAAIRELCPGTSVIGVEPELAADARDSLRRGTPVGWAPEATGRTIADALRADRVGSLTLAHILRHVDDIVTVTEDELRETVRRLALEARLVAEPGGAVAVAACLFRPELLATGGTRVAVLSGGNIDPALLSAIVGRGGSGDRADIVDREAIVGPRGHRGPRAAGERAAGGVGEGLPAP
ncbi:MAG TPA: threonine/serine dehydratase [Streptosporangiaceae bacterium]|nr:threonine/serine dehydratase [Streptosporangiaceae bacterium]